jgi:hypothetical protein
MAYNVYEKPSMEGIKMHANCEGGQLKILLSDVWV